MSFGRSRFLCSIPWCWNRYEKAQNGSISFHSFPKTPELFSKWLELTGLPPDTKRENFKKKICSYHFDSTDYQIRRGAILRLLKADAVPKRTKYPVCCFYGCNNQNEPNSPFQFYRFPIDSYVRKQWIAATDRSGFIPKKESVVCSAHFSRKCYKNDVLKGLAVPDSLVHVVPSNDPFRGEQVTDLEVDPLSLNTSEHSVSIRSFGHHLTSFPSETSDEISTESKLENAIQIQRHKVSSPGNNLTGTDTFERLTNHVPPLIKTEGIPVDEGEFMLNEVKIEPNDEFNEDFIKQEPLCTVTPEPLPEPSPYVSNCVDPLGDISFSSKEVQIQFQQTSALPCSPPEVANVPNEREVIAFEKRTAAGRPHSPTEQALRKKAKMLHEKIRRRDQTIKKLKVVISDLKKQLKPGKRRKALAKEMGADEELEIDFELDSSE